MLRPMLAALVLLDAASALAAPDQAVIDPAVCDRMVAHRPAPDVEYRPGVDVRGRPVVPADLGGIPVELPHEIGVEILVPWPQALRRPGARPARLRGEIYAGYATVTPDGTVYFNGRPLTDPEQDHLAFLCREAGGRPR